MGQVALFVIVITGATDQKVATEQVSCTLAIERADSPALCLGIPVGVLRLLTKADVRQDAMLLGGIGNVLADGKRSQS